MKRTSTEGSPGRQSSRAQAGRSSPDRAGLRLAGSLSVAGVVVSLAAGLLHADSADANDHPAAFAAYARSSIWTAVHLGQFVGMALLVAGLLALLAALTPTGGSMAWTARSAVVTAASALALYAALQAVDGVALKQAVDAWAAAAESAKETRFAAAEGIRWLEWGLRSYQSFLLGAALLLTGAVVRSRRVPRPVGYLMALAGLAYIAQGWIIGAEGFSAANTVPTLAGIVLTFAWTLWLLVIAWAGQDVRGRGGTS